MTTPLQFNQRRSAFITVALGLLVSAANAQPASGTQGDMKKPMPMMDMKQGQSSMNMGSPAMPMKK